MTQVGDLLRLQELDSELVALRGQLDSIGARIEGNEEVAAARAHEEACRAELLATEREQRQVEGAVEDLSAKIRPDEKRLYDGSVKSPKELQAIQHEVETLKERRTALEEHLIGLLDLVETARAAHVEAADTLGRAEGQWRAETVHLREDRDRVVARVTRLEAEREDTRGLVPRQSLVLYDSLRQRKGGTAVVPVRGGTCDGCRVLLPDAVRRRAATSPTPMQCPNCERILSAGG